MLVGEIIAVVTSARRYIYTHDSEVVKMSLPFYDHDAGEKEKEKEKKNSSARLRPSAL